MNSTRFENGVDIGREMQYTVGGWGKSKMRDFLNREDNINYTKDFAHIRKVKKTYIKSASTKGVETDVSEDYLFCLATSEVIDITTTTNSSIYTSVSEGPMYKYYSKYGLFSRSWPEPFWLRSLSKAGPASFFCDVRYGYVSNDFSHFIKADCSGFCI